MDKREEKKISTEDIIKMVELVLKNNYFEFNGQVKHQISSTLALKLHLLIHLSSWMR